MTDRNMFTCLCYAVDHSCTYKILSYFIHVYLPTISFISPPPIIIFLNLICEYLYVYVTHSIKKSDIIAKTSQYSKQYDIF